MFCFKETKVLTRTTTSLHDMVSEEPKTSLATVLLIVLFNTLRLISVLGRQKWPPLRVLWKPVADSGKHCSLGRHTGLAVDAACHLSQLVPKERATAGDLYAEKVGKERTKLAYLLETLQPISLAVQQEAQQLLYSALSRRSLGRRQIAGNRQ